MRISLIVAILAALGAGVFGYIEVTKQIPALVQQRDTERTDKKTAQADASKTHAELTRTQTVLGQTQRELADSKVAQKKAEDNAAAQTKIASDLTGKLAKANADLDAAQAELAAYKGTGKKPEEIAQMVQMIRQDQDAIDALNAEKAVFLRSIARLTNQLADLLEQRLLRDAPRRPQRQGR